jgi:ketosteroid isomerase-like protein
MMSDTSIGSAAETTIRTYYDAADNGDADRALALFADDAEIRFGNSESVTGASALLDAAATLHTVCSSMRHDIADVFVNADQTRGTAELAMTYVRHDGSELQVPAAGVFSFDSDHSITSYHVYVDLGELFAGGGSSR